MVKPTVILTVITTVCLSIDKVYSLPLNIDIQNFLQALQEQLRLEQLQSSPRAQQVNRLDDDDEKSHYGSLQKQEVERLLSFINKDKQSNKEVKRLKQQLSQSDQVLENYFNQVQDNNARERAPLVPNDLIGLLGRQSSESSEGDRDDDVDNTGDFSKVYVLLDSEAVKKSRNKDRLNSLLSSLMSAPPARNSRSRHGKRNRGYTYKGFVINSDDLLRRAGRGDSGEMFAKDPIAMESYKEPVRPRQRESRGRGRGGGGGAGGHTAIPYIRQRGDIYERERED